jgi:Na+/proline symporter/nitrogen-specific signal transduction histidine kinase
MTVWFVLVVSLAYLGLLFGIAWFADRRADSGRSVINSSLVYALSLGVYCTTWTFYGSVGRAAASGIGFLPIYLGPTLLFALGGVILHKMVRIAKANRITSIADFIASRYGKSQLLGGLVTVIAVIGVVPYIALQLKAVSSSFRVLVGDDPLALTAGVNALPMWADGALFVAVVLAAFTIVFGTRDLDATERHEGMVAAIAFESVVKLLAFLVAGGVVMFAINDPGELFDRLHEAPWLQSQFGKGNASFDYGNWVALTVLAFFAALLLPRQFQIAVVENINPEHLRRAMWLFPLYLLLINLFVLPIAAAGLLYLPTGSDADSFVLTLPLNFGYAGITLFVFIGGLSAATGMVIVETIALSTMVCNDLVMPVLLRLKILGMNRRDDLSRLLLGIRRIAIALIVGLGYLYFRIAGEAYALVSIGLISFAAIVQFAPAVIGGMYWRGGTRNGALAGLVVGFLVWAYTLLLPSFAKSGWLPVSFLDHGALSIELLRPQQLFGLVGLNEITHCLVWSLLLNLSAYVGVSLLRSPDSVELRQASVFVDELGSQLAPVHGIAEYSDLLSLVTRFLGRARALEEFERYALTRGLKRASALRTLHADAALVSFAETLLTGAIGSASAHVMVSSVAKVESLGLDEVLNILDEASQIRRYSQELEEKSRELTRTTAELREANERLLELDRMKDDFISTVTHELRTPLTSIRAFSEMLLDDPKIDLAERTRFLGIIVSETERLTRLINQILDLAKLESGRAEWVSEDVDVLEVLRNAIESLSALCGEKGVSIELAESGGTCVVSADRDRLMQVVINLLSNAVKFVAPNSGRIKVGAGSTAQTVTVVVDDNGPGLRPEQCEPIFEKFHQAGDVLTDKPTGTGLGLPIARQIVELFGGRLWAESHPGPGARFCFTLPVHHPAHQSET